MPNLKIIGWDTGRNKILMVKILQEKIGLGIEEFQGHRRCRFGR